MEPFDFKKFSFEYKIDKKLIELVSEANEKYGIYRALLFMHGLDSTYFLKGVISNDAFKSNRLENIFNGGGYYNYEKGYFPHTQLASVIDYFNSLGDIERLTLDDLNRLHKILLLEQRSSSTNFGELRTKQNYIKSGNDIEFIPPRPECITYELEKLLEYMADSYSKPDMFINCAITHAWFETIHPYSDGNGRLGRALIPINQSLQSEEEPILYLSEVLDIYKPQYHKCLQLTRKGELTPFIKFFLQTVIEQCNMYIIKLKELEEKIIKKENKEQPQRKPKLNI